MIDLHNHTILCNHSQGSMDEFIQQAIKQGISIYGFSDHAPMEFDKKYRMDNAQTVLYESWIDNLKSKYPQIEILKGYEVDFTPIINQDIINKKNIDYLIGSIHFLDNWGFDNPEFLSLWQERDIDDIYKEYFDLVIKLAQSKMFDIVGHLDLIKVFNFKPNKDIKILAKQAIQAIADNNLTIEINTAGIRKPVKEPYPSIALLEMINEYNIDITFGSDAHNPSQVGFKLKECYELAKFIGFKKVTYFKNREKKFKSLG